MLAPRIRAAFAWPLPLSRPLALAALAAILATLAAVTISSAAAATAPSLVPTGDGSRDAAMQARGTTALYDAIDDTIGGADDGTTYVQSSAGASGLFFVLLADMPSDFASMTSLTIDVRARTQNRVDDLATVYAQVFAADETTPLSNEVTVATNPGASAWATFSGVALGGLTAGNKSLWNGARLRIRVAQNPVGSSDGSQVRITAVELDAVYATGDGGSGGTTPPPTTTEEPPTVAPPSTSGTTAPAKGIWITQSEIGALPTSGSAWTAVKAAADGSLGTARVSDQSSEHDVKTLAVALVYARTGQATYRKKAADAVMSAVGTETGGRTLALARNLTAYVIAADLVNLKAYDAAKDSQFRSWLSGVRTASLDGETLIATHERRANNWGTAAGAARIAADVYLGDTVDLGRAVSVFQGWLGDRTKYAGFSFGDLAWQADPANPVGINKKGALIQGKNVDGVLPDDQRRSGGFTWPAPQENYVWGALGPAYIQAELLAHAGYPAYSWSDSALKRAIVWLHAVNNFPASGDDGWVPWIANAAYGTSYPAPSRTNGKVMGWTAWTHG